MLRFLACILMIALIACGENRYVKDIRTLDSLRTEVKKVQVDFKKMDSTRMLDISREVTSNLRSLQRVYSPDSIDIYIASMINYYKSFRKSGAKFNIQRVRVKEEIPYTIKQLNSLITDLENNALKKEDALEFIEKERNAAIELTQTFRFMEFEASKAYRNFDSIKVIMNKFIDSLQRDSANIQAIRLKLLKAKTKKTK